MVGTSRSMVHGGTYLSRGGFPCWSRKSRRQDFLTISKIVRNLAIGIFRRWDFSRRDPCRGASFYKGGTFFEFFFPLSSRTRGTNPHVSISSNPSNWVQETADGESLSPVVVSCVFCTGYLLLWGGCPRWQRQHLTVSISSNPSNWVQETG